MASLQEAQRAALAKPRTIGVSSPAFEPGKAIPREHSGRGDDESPELRLTSVPTAARRLAIVVDDPDAPGGTFTHWTAWDFEPTTRIPRGATAATLDAVEGRNDFGSTGYRGPLPPSGTHRYYFRVFALDGPLDLPRNATPDEVWKALPARTIAWGELMGTFSKP